jgi:hypothetical protein
MISHNKRFIVAALFVLTPFVSLNAVGQSKRHPPHHGHGPGHHLGGPGIGALDPGGNQTSSVSISQPNPADEIDAWSRWNQSDQTVKLMREQVKRERLISKQLIEDYERRVRENTPSPEEERQMIKKVAWLRSLDPPDYEIHTGLALNILLEDLKPFQVGAKGPQVPLPQDMLGNINVISVQDREGNMAVLKNRGRLSWPSVLRAAEYQEARETLTSLAPKAIDQAVQGGLQLETLRGMEDALGKLNGRLAGNIKNLPTPRHIESKRYLNELKEALKLLEKPHAGDYFSGKFSAQGKTIGELIQHMSKQGLRFAPAVAGDEAAYEFLHRYMVVYAVVAHQSRSPQD